MKKRIKEVAIILIVSGLLVFAAYDQRGYWTVGGEGLLIMTIIVGWAILRFQKGVKKK